MAVTRYAVLGTSTKNWSSTSAWSTSSGGATGASAPGNTDTAILNGDSGTGTMTLDSDVSALAQMLVTAAFTGTLVLGSHAITAIDTLLRAGTFTSNGAGAIRISGDIVIGAPAASWANYGVKIIDFI